MPGSVPDRVILYRITHYQNLPDIVQRGLFAAHHLEAPPDSVRIGNPEIIDRRGREAVPVPPGGVLNDYVPFYLGAHSPMLLQISTGHRAPLVPQRPQREIIYLCSELSRVQLLGLPFVFTNGHACVKPGRQFFTDPTQLGELDWNMIPAKQWSRTDDDNDRQRRKEAEFLVYQHVPVAALIGLAVYDAAMADWVSQVVAEAGVNLKVAVLPKWYY